MPNNKNEQPVVTNFSDHEVITPPNRLGKAVAPAGVPNPADDPLARAEQALAQLSTEFSGWMDAECGRLDAARMQIRKRGISKETHEALFHAAHDIKGEAATFGFPAVAPVAEGLCRLLEHTPDAGRIPIALIEQHVDAVRAITREYERTDASKLAAELTETLREVTEAFLVRANRHRPDYLEGIASPSLAPGDAF